MKNFLKNKGISMIVCDLAGTTINESGIIYQSIYNTLNKSGYTAKKSDMKRWYGRDKNEVMKEHILKFDKKLDNKILQKLEASLIDELSEEYFTNDRVQLIDKKLPEFCKDLQNNDILVTLNTGYPKCLQNKIVEHFEMNKFVNDWISSSEVQRGRPYPHMINKMRKKHNIDSKNIAKFGDTVNDILEGKNANCGLVVGVLSSTNNEEELLNAGADIVINKITDLK